MQKGGPVPGGRRARRHPRPLPSPPGPASLFRTAPAPRRSLKAAAPCGAPASPAWGRRGRGERGDRPADLPFCLPSRRFASSPAAAGGGGCPRRALPPPPLPAAAAAAADSRQSPARGGWAPGAEKLPSGPSPGPAGGAASQRRRPDFARPGRWDFLRFPRRASGVFFWGGGVGVPLQRRKAVRQLTWCLSASFGAERRAAISGACTPALEPPDRLWRTAGACPAASCGPPAPGCHSRPPPRSGSAFGCSPRQPLLGCGRASVSQARVKLPFPSPRRPFSWGRGQLAAFGQVALEGGRRAAPAAPAKRAPGKDGITWRKS